ncbi:hypothetical protein EJ074_01635 [Mesorhizobium sp. M3A.F.Ca.ET.080.04.2.1]|nr:hypothetical protein EJ074_01635 [Mesorhizobium sp. M3A.F.Ca.ET.080.04.2.1]RWF16763.1 MAG: hypothetical protein EOS64_24485 [Mesorhizobium sp.]
MLEARRDRGLRHGDFFALNSLRMEKRYRDSGHDIGEEDTPYKVVWGSRSRSIRPVAF